ncbi:hypothetical protein BJX70DRAFT_216908 [Aspergillus crustosus]
MTGEDESNRKKAPTSPRSSQQWPEEESPLDAVSRFADEQISSLLHSILGIPSTYAAPRSERWDVFEDERKYRDAQLRQRRGYSDDGNDYRHTGTSSDPRQQDQYSSQNNSFPFDIDRFSNAYFNRFWLDGDPFASRLFSSNHRPTLSMLTSANSPTWPVSYILFSDYSPLRLHLEARDRNHQEQGDLSSLLPSLSPSSEHVHNEPKWCDAFEDLLRLENEEQMLDREPDAVAKPQTGKEWLQNLVKRGSLGNNWKVAAGLPGQPWSGVALELSKFPDHEGHYPEGTEKPDTGLKSEVGSDRLTELDLYERFLAGIDSREQDSFDTFHPSPLVRLLLEDRRRARNGIPPHKKDHTDEDTESWLESVSGGNRHSVPGTSEARSDVTAETSTVEPAVENAYVTSTQISTERVRLPDGSIQTKTVKTKRFADGREETNESVETFNPPQRGHSTDQQGPTSERNANGWFWKD